MLFKPLQKSGKPQSDLSTCPDLWSKPIIFVQEPFSSFPRILLCHLSSFIRLDVISVFFRDHFIDLHVLFALQIYHSYMSINSSYIIVISNVIIVIGYISSLYVIIYMLRPKIYIIFVVAMKHYCKSSSLRPLIIFSSFVLQIF